jgi:hypothetical protein
MRLRSLLACTASASIVLGSYACNDTNPSALPVYSQDDAGTEGLADTAPPPSDAATFDVAFLIESGAPDAGDANSDAEGDANAADSAGESDSPSDAPTG